MTAARSSGADRWIIGFVKTVIKECGWQIVHEGATQDVPEGMKASEAKKEILWIGAPPLPVQIERLKRLFGPVKLILDTTETKSAEAIAALYRESGASDIVVVVSASIIDHLCRQGVYPLYPVMVRVENPDEADLHLRDQYLAFRGFRRLTSVRLVFDPAFVDSFANWDDRAQEEQCRPSAKPDRDENPGGGPLSRARRPRG